MESNKKADKSFSFTYLYTNIKQLQFNKTIYLHTEI